MLKLPTAQPPPRTARVLISQPSQTPSPSFRRGHRAPYPEIAGGSSTPSSHSAV
ncbi:hypothetical protein K432DRAFT_386022 [Lepidopterella palustris CBS 459.81]|uniref:Uncharacterized protein n=1 Tax=Lepidopterella palustris CBS 459.81 TaxID=1314670 RepID=A0A8E2JAR4_9PEZI|nr:hypothetical protein K432DRAFT_386022 [Lepidopterella palustris CBS 459.81]